MGINDSGLTGSRIVLASRNHLDLKVVLQQCESVNTDLLIKRLRGGFRPFSLRLTDGRSIQVPHPEFIAVSPRIVIAVDKGGFPLHIDPLHIVSLDEKPAPRNGPSVRRRRK